MSEENTPSFAVGLTDAHKNELEKMVQGLRRTKQETGHGENRDAVASQLERITGRLADLTEIVLALERQFTPLLEIVHLSHEKSEVLSRRLDAVIAAMQKK